MFRVYADTIVATVTELRRRTSELMAIAEAGEDIVIHKDNEPQGVYLSFDRYQHLMEMLDRLEDAELAEVAIARKEAIDRGAMRTIPLREMLERHAPELLEESDLTEEVSRE